jgi:Domain of unknown function (DU1801)
VTTPSTPDEYIESLPAGRREVMAAVRDVINANLPDGYEEGMLYGIISWHVPLERFPDTYNGRPLALAGLGNRKNYMTVYLNNVYGNPRTEVWFKERWADTGKKLSMGKSCVYFKKLDDLPLDVVGEVIAREPLDAFIAHYEKVRGSSRKARRG